MQPTTTCRGVLLLLSFLFSGLLFAQLDIPAKSKSDSKVSSILQLIYDEDQNGVSDRPEYKQVNRSLLLIDNGQVRLEASAVSSGEALARELRLIGASGISVYKRKVNAWLPIEAIPDLNSVKELVFAEVVYLIPGEIGSVDSEADSAMAVKAARNQFCIDGSGVKIGVISDTYNANGGAAAGVSSGDLPGVGNPNGYTTPVTVVQDAPSGIDEGRAMCELIHDLSPGAELCFNSALYGQAAFANAIIGLANTHNCDVIVDDIRYFEEPFYMDGLIAQACDQVFAQGVPYFASAGNYANSSYEAAYNGFTGGSGFNFHDFDPGGGVDTMQSITVNGGSSINITLQWDDPWGTLTPNSPNTDLDLLILNGAGTVFIASSIRDNFVTLEPTEFIGLSAPPGPPVTYNILINKFSGPDPAAIKWVIRNAQGLVINEYPSTTVSGQATGYGHSNAAGANAVGACAWYDSPAYGTNPPLPEPFTSYGGVQIRYDTNGNPITPIIRQKPNFTAIDGVSNTFFGGGNNFFGTSAAAPNAAAVAALMLQADSNLTPQEVRDHLANTTIDMLTPGFDYVTGTGLVQADDALTAVYDSGCVINNITVFSPPVYEAGDTTYSVGIQVTYDTPNCLDSVIVNGQCCALLGPGVADIFLTGLPADGQPVNITAELNRSGCSLTVPALFNALPPPTVLDTLVITEIMYDPPESSTDSLEFIEIYNPGQLPVNLTGYQFTAGVSHVFGNVSIPGGGYVVVCEDSMALYRQFASSGYEWSGALSNGGELVVLKDDQGRTLDSVDYDDSNPWPSGADGDGPSIVLCDWTADNSLGANWTESTKASGVVINGNELKGSPGSEDQACLACLPETLDLFVYSCDSTQADTTVQILTNQQGCDSTVTTYVLFDPGSLSMIGPASICLGDSALIFGVWRSVAGVYYDSLTNAQGCDSVLRQELTVNLQQTITLPLIEICIGDSVLIFGQYRFASGVFYDSLSSATGCDSTLAQELNVQPAYLIPFPSQEICLGDSVLVFGLWRTTAGTYYDTLQSSLGCDSILVRPVLLLPVFTANPVLQSICQGDSALIFGQWQQQAGVYYDSLSSQDGCDSILAVQLSINPTDTVYQNMVTNDSSQAGIYDTLYANRFGCDSLVITTLIYLPGPCATLDSTFITQLSCDSNQAGMVVQTFTGSDGCDSVVTTITAYDPGSLSILASLSICAGDSAQIFGQWQSGAGTFYDSLLNRNGCDSVLQQSLLVNPSDTVMVQQVTNDSTQAGIFDTTYVNRFGCDSLVITTVIYQPGPCATLDSTFIHSVTCDSTQAGTGILILSGSDGCDSVVTTTTVYDPGSFTVLASLSICDGDSVQIFGQWQSQSGIYYDSLLNQNGCDSIRAQSLQVNPSYFMEDTITICQGDSALIFGQWQSQAGGYLNFSTTAAGCDSLNLVTLQVDTTANCQLQDSLSCVSDSSWLESTVVGPSDRRGRWTGVSSLPSAATYTMFATIGQPYPWGGLKLVEGADPIIALSEVRYFKKSFSLSDPNGYNARIQMYMDDGCEIYLNGHLLAREENMDFRNGKTAPHDLAISSSGVVSNAYAGHDAFDVVPANIDLDTVLQSGSNELVVVMRNPAGGSNIGGFSFRMELNRLQIPVIPVKQLLEIEEDDWLVFPNPTQGWVQVELLLPDIEPMQLQLFDIRGRLLRSFTFDGGQQQLQLDLSDLPAGLYQLGLLSSGELDFRPLMIE